MLGSGLLAMQIYVGELLFLDKEFGFLLLISSDNFQFQTVILTNTWFLQFLPLVWFKKNSGFGSETEGWLNLNPFLRYSLIIRCNYDIISCLLLSFTGS